MKLEVLVVVFHVVFLYCDGELFDVTTIIRFDSLWPLITKDTTSAALNDFDYTITVHARNNARGLPILLDNGSVLSTSVGADVEECYPYIAACKWQAKNMVLMYSESAPIITPGKNAKKSFANKTPIYPMHNNFEFKFSSKTDDGVLGILLSLENDSFYENDIYYFYLRDGNETSFLLKCGPTISSSSCELPSNMGNRNCIVIARMDLQIKSWSEVKVYTFKVMAASGYINLQVESEESETLSMEWQDKNPLNVNRFSLGTIDLTGEFTVVYGNVWTLTGMEGYLLSPPFVPSYKKVCMTITSYKKEESNINLNVILPHGNSISFSCMQSSAMANGWSTSLYISELPANIVFNNTSITVKLTATSSNDNGVLIQRIAGCSGRDSEDVFMITQEKYPYLTPRGYDIAVDNNRGNEVYPNKEHYTTVPSSEFEYYSTEFTTEGYDIEYSASSKNLQLNTHGLFTTESSADYNFPYERRRRNVTEELAIPDRGLQICLNGGSYLNEQGICLCPAGFIGKTCERGCGPNKYGSKCDGRCSKINRGCKAMKLCRPKLGCNCAPGLKGSFCTSECDAGWYGVECREQCGFCSGENSCDPYDGTCIYGCSEGYYPPYCKEKYSFIEVAPKIYHIGFRTIRITANLKREKFSGRGNPRFYQFQYRAETEENWSHLEPQPMINTPVEAEIPDLVPGTVYEIRVVIHDEDGNSYQGTDLPLRQVRTKCHVFNDVNYNLQENFITEDSFSITWNYTDMGSLTCRLDHFDVELNEDWRWLSHNVGRKTSATFSGMLPAQDYQVRVRAITVAGAAKYSDILHIQTKGEEPEAVVDFRLIRTLYDEFKVEWSPPLETAGTIQYYSLSYECRKLLACNQSDCSISSGEMHVIQTTAEIQDLLPHAQYAISVAAVSVKRGPERQLLAVTDMTEPQVFPVESAKPVSHRTNTSFTVHWDSPNCRSLNGYLYGYHYSLFKENSSETITKNHTHLKYVTFKNLMPFTLYKVLVYVETSAGWNRKYPLEITARTRATVPGPVQNLTVYKRERRMLGLRWSLPKNMFGSLKSFKIICKPNNFKIMSSVVEPTLCTAWPNMYCYTFGSLHPNIEHLIKVTAKNNEADEDGETAIVQTTTIEDYPEAPTSLEIISQTENSLTIEWGIPNILNGQLNAFLISIQQIDSADPKNCCVGYNVQEMKVKQEQPVYLYQAEGLRSAATYSISVSAKSVLTGNGIRTIGYTKPPVPYMDGNIRIIGNLDSVSRSATVKLVPLTQAADIIRGYLLLIFPESPEDDFVGSDIWDEWLQEEIGNNTNGDDFYISREFSQDDLEKESEVTVGTGTEESTGKWGEIHDPVLKPGRAYHMGFVAVLEYNGLRSMGYTETMRFTTGT